MRVDFPFTIPGIRPVLFLLHLHSSAIEQIKLIAFVIRILSSEPAVRPKINRDHLSSCRLNKKCPESSQNIYSSCKSLSLGSPSAFQFLATLTGALIRVLEAKRRGLDRGSLATASSYQRINGYRPCHILSK